MAALGPVEELADKYRGEFEETYEELRKLSQSASEQVRQRLQLLQEQLQSIQPQVAQQSDEVLKSLQSVEPVKAALPNKLLPVFSLVAIMQVVQFTTAFLSSYALFPLIGLVLGGFWTAVLAFALLPVLAYYHLVLSGDTERAQRFKLLGFAAAEGLLLGFLFSHRYLSSMQPLAFITPLAVALSALQAGVLLGEGASRASLLGACLGSGALLHLALGLLLGQLSAGYLLLVILHTAAAYVTIQLYFKSAAANPEGVNDYLYMLGYTVAALVAQAVVFLLLGGPKPVEE